MDLDDMVERGLGWGGHSQLHPTATHRLACADCVWAAAPPLLGVHFLFGRVGGCCRRGRPPLGSEKAGERCWHEPLTSSGPDQTYTGCQRAGVLAPVGGRLGLVSSSLLRTKSHLQTLNPGGEPRAGTYWKAGLESSYAPHLSHSVAGGMRAASPRAGVGDHPSVTLRE